MTTLRDMPMISAEQKNRFREAALKVEQERDELAAHAARLAAWIKEHGWHSDTCDILDLDEQGCHKSCSCGLGAINDTPETSLARRDARMKAEALEDMANAYEDYHEILDHLRDAAEAYRKQAEGDSQ